ncbi:tautomerase family protein [Pseudonocardia sp. GCM10023141]|uniref:tautomerase family protein n=1 Tax=Pseudonocardia sp. GCM10023141 TaxID=3252653 RepID=UPI00360F9017
MPIAHFHLVRSTFTPDQGRRLLVRAAEVYAEVLDSPLERIRTYLAPVEPGAMTVGGTLVADGGEPAPYFTAVVLEGRPAAQRAELLRRFTDLLVEILNASRPTVRGRIIEVSPDDWGIGGEPASAVRAPVRTGTPPSR